MGKFVFFVFFRFFGVVGVVSKVGRFDILWVNDFKRCIRSSLDFSFFICRIRIKMAGRRVVGNYSFK